MLDMIRLIAGTLCIALSLFFIISGIIGNFRFPFVLNRMHAAGLIDTAGVLFMILGLVIFNGWNPVSLKLLTLIVLVWLTSPASSHLIAVMEVSDGKYRKQLLDEKKKEGENTP